MAERDLAPDERLRIAPQFLLRPDGWVVMDRLGLAFLSPPKDGYTCIHFSGGYCVSDAPHYFGSRREAREAYAAWRGSPNRPGRPKTNPDRKLENNDRIRFERLFACLMYLWKRYPSAVTLDAVQAHVQKLMRREFHQRSFRRDMDNLVKYGYCTKNGPTYNAVPEFRRWWSDEFGDGPTPRSSA